MTAKLFTLPKQVPFTNSGALIPGAKAYFYLNGTSTPQDTYTTADLDVAHTNPVIADGNGRFPAIYMDASLSYKVKITDASGVEKYTEDAFNIIGDADSISIDDVAANFTATSVEGALAEIISNLASTANTLGASMVGIEDTATNLTATDVEAAFAEVFTSLADPAKVLLYGGTPQSLSGAGAVDVTSAVTHITTTGVDALTLANGVPGQRKYIVMIADGGDGTLTPANLGNGTTITFDDVGDSADLLFTNSAWHFMGGTATLA